MNVKVFGQLTDITGPEPLSVTDAGDLEDLNRRLVATFPGLKEKTYVIAVNRKIVHENIPLAQGDEIALLPPFSGG